MKRWISLAIVLSLFATLNAKEEATALAWRFAEGQILSVKLNQDLNTSVAVLGNDLKTAFDVTCWFTWKVKDVDPSGNAKIAVTLNRVKLKMDSPQLGKSDVDSQVDLKEGKQLTGLDGQLLALYKPLFGVEMTQQVSAQGKVSKVIIPDDVASELRKAAIPGVPGATEVIAGLNASLPEFPQEPLRLDQSWTTEAQVDSAPGISANMKNTYTYKGSRIVKSRSMHQIDVDIDFTLQTDSGPKIDVVEQSTGGAVYFDSVVGRLVGISTKQDATIKLTIGTQEIQQTIISNSKVLFTDQK